MKSYGSSVFQYLRATYFRYVLEVPRTRRIRSTYNLSYERYGATIKVFTASSLLVQKSAHGAIL